eukprot:107883-Chlamydomonas_euryale.AAC.1
MQPGCTHPASSSHGRRHRTHRLIRVWPALNHHLAKNTPERGSASALVAHGHKLASTLPVPVWGACGQTLGQRPPTSIPHRQQACGPPWAWPAA